MNHERVIKRVSKQGTNSESDSSSMKEAEILLNLRHPNIPILYDLEEDEEYFYIVEEYIVGESMADYLYLHQSISHKELTKIAIEIYDVLEFLHNLNNPICYQDMKLEHIYLSNGRIVLIDYGIASYLRDNEKSKYGTLSYVSSEQLEGKCKLSNDIYNTKVALKRIYDSSKEKRNLAIERRLNLKDFNSAQEEKRLWISIYERKNNVKKHLDVKIGVVGNDVGIGVSHIAIALCSYLNSKGVVSYYIDCCEKKVIENIIARYRGFFERDNIIYHDSFKGVKVSGEAVLEEIPPQGLYIMDFGTDVQAARTCDVILYVVSSRPYKSNEIDDIAKEYRTFVIINPALMLTGVEVAKIVQKKVYAFPIDEDPFSITKKKEKLFNRILERIEGST